MRFVLNTHSDDMGSQVCIYDLQTRLREQGYDAVLNDWDHYDRYDVAVFMGFDHEMEKARSQNADIRVALCDPKLSKPEWIQASREADFLVVSSVEQRDAFWRLNRNIHIHYMFPAAIPARERLHTDHTPIVIGYHGNRVHLECMFEGLQPALDELSRRHRLEFWAMYNLGHGEASIGIPDDSRVKVRHIPWSWDNYTNELAKADIGVVPSLMPVRDRLATLRSSAYPEAEFMYQPFDHLLRFKASTNPGRIFPFARFGIPVVADFAPSNAQFIQDGQSGFLVSSPNGWYEALDQMAGSAVLRQRMSDALRSGIEAAYDDQVDAFVDFCGSDLAKGEPARFQCVPSAEQELAQLSGYRRPGRKTFWARLKNRLT